MIPCINRLWLTSSIEKQRRLAKNRIPRITTFYFFSHLTGNHQSIHFEIAGKRKEGILKRSWTILLNKEMAGPGATVTKHNPKQQKPCGFGKEDQCNTDP